MSQISIVRAHRLRFIQPWLLQHYAGTPGFRIERMLKKLVTEKFTDHRGIVWAEIVSQHKDLAGHTESDTGWFFNWSALKND